MATYPPSASMDMFSVFEQLKSLETSFLSILMESALRLDALLGANVFLLVETTEGRRIAGSESLCRRFVDNALHHDAGDIRVKLNGAGSSLTEEPSSPFEDRIYCQEFVDSFPQPMRKRSLMDHPNVSKNKRKRTQGRNAPFPPTDLEVVSINSTESLVVEPKTEIVETFDSSEEDREALCVYRGPNVPSAVPTVGSFLPAPAMMQEYVATNPKIAALADKAAAEVIVDKSSVDVKLLSSVVNDIGKMVADYAVLSKLSEEERKELMSACFDFFWSYIPWLQFVNRQAKLNDKSNKNLRKYLRDQCCGAVCHRLKQLLKRESESSDLLT